MWNYSTTVILTTFDILQSGFPTLKYFDKMALTGSSSSVDENFVEEVTQGTSMTTREEICEEDLQDDDGSSCYQVIHHK